MQISLKILKGSKAGKKLPVAGPKFLIGRGEDCQLRPHSDMISRRHCLITIEGDEVRAQELGSKNGTYINDERIEGERVLAPGDVLRVGPLEFEVCITSDAQTKVESPAPQEVAASTPVEPAANNHSSRGDASELTIDDDISGWLDEADSEDKTRRLTQPDTRQFKLDDTQRVSLDQSAEDTNVGKDSKKKKKQEPGKLPPPPALQGKDSKEAASIMLKKLFNRG